MSVLSGENAPNFNHPTGDGGECKLSDFKRKPLVLYFYPKGDTPGCTTEAQGFRDAMAEFANFDATIVGVSKDTVKKHDRFKARHDLNFTLISDEDGTLCEAYGVWVEKNLYGRKYMGIERSTYLIDGEGKIAKVWRKVRVKGHVDNVLKAVQAL